MYIYKVMQMDLQIRYSDILQNNMKISQQKYCLYNNASLNKSNKSDCFGPKVLDVHIPVTLINNKFCINAPGFKPVKPSLAVALSKESLLYCLVMKAY